jgi:uncharacterized protein YjiS (DUF1127 family)
MEHAMSATSTALHRARTAWPRLSARGMLDRWDAFYRERETLRSLDDYMLRDIGINRADVDAELRRRG